MDNYTTIMALLPLLASIFLFTLVLGQTAIQFNVLVQFRNDKAIARLRAKLEQLQPQEADTDLETIKRPETTAATGDSLRPD